MIALGQVFVVEGRYDKNRLKQLFDAAVLETSGFGIFNDRQKLALLRRLAESRGLIVLTDSDGAGLVIRNFIKGAVEAGTVYHAYIPAIPGKERRKARPGREGLLGVEGVSDAVIVEAVRKSGVLDAPAARPKEPPITKADLYALGLSGRPDSRGRRLALCRALDLPENLSAGSLLEILNVAVGRAGLLDLLANTGRERGDGR